MPLDDDPRERPLRALDPCPADAAPAMTPEFQKAVLDAIRAHPAIESAAITGSQARGIGGDAYSDLDLLLVAHDLEAVRAVHTWLPRPERILLADSHLTDYCSVLLADHEKVDLALFSADDPAADWVVHDYRVIKGDAGFETRLAAAKARTRERTASYLDPDRSGANVLLPTTATKRSGRGERLSAHGFLTTAADLLLALGRRKQNVEAQADLLNPRRRLEQRRPAAAEAMHASLFVPPEEGVRALARYLGDQHRGDLMDPEGLVLKQLLTSPPLR